LIDILRLGTILPERCQRAQQQHAQVLQQQLYYDGPVRRVRHSTAIKEYDSTWGVLLVYLLGRWACWQSYHRQRLYHIDQAGNDDEGEVVLSWKDDVESLVTVLFREEGSLLPRPRHEADQQEPHEATVPSFVEFFPRILPEQTLAGLAMLQLDILANDGKVQWAFSNKQPVLAVSVHDMSPWHIANKYLIQNEFSG
jgi:hypothetical protein